MKKLYLPSLHWPAALTRLQSDLQSKYAALPTRDQFALAALGIFLGIFALVLMVYGSHKYYQEGLSQWESAQNLKLWMQEVAPTLSTDNAAGGDLQSLVNTTAGQQGISANVKPTGDIQRIEVTTTHPNYLALGSWLSRMSSMGVQIDQLEMKQQPDKSIAMTAIISR